ncbi:glycosyltransferase family 4 protein [Rubripirellula amarantea]|nr:glycosyltransferase family 4 protein [Rubripirellula amarantea]
MLQPPVPVAHTVPSADFVVPSATDDHASAKPNGKLSLVRVLHVVNGEHFSGAERVQSHLGRCLPEFAVAADFACVKPGRFAELIDQQQGQWGRGHRSSMKGRFDFRPVFALRDLVRSEGYQVLHAHTPRTAMVTAIAAKLCGVPWIYHVHSPASRDCDNPITNRVNAFIERQSLRGCDHVITVSESLRNDCIAKGVPDESVTVVHNGVPAIRPPRSATPTANGRWVIGMIALMRARKGLEVMLEALAKLKASHHDVVLRIIGPFETEEYRQSTDSLIQKLGVQDRIERVGFTNDVPGELAKLDAMVLPSLFGEGLPMVVLEAMAAAVPVIATRVEGTPEAVTHGVEGLLAEPRDPESLANAIAELVTGKHDWNAMAETAFETHAKRFSDLAMARGTADVYRKVLANKKATDGSLS